MTKNPYSEKRSELFSLAASQKGYFTAKQAGDIGYSRGSITYYVSTGVWERALDKHGIYRLSNYPMQKDESLVIWSLWTMNANDEFEGTISHESALSALELSDLMPYTIHMTVPSRYGRKRRVSITQGVVELHGAHLAAYDVMECEDYNVTRPLRTITDLLKAQTSALDFLDQAFNEGVERGLISLSDLNL